MSEYQVHTSWKRQPSETFTDNKYSRAHQWVFDGGAVVNASSAPQIVPLPYSVAENVDPEEAFVASLSSCHMLFFLSIAASHKYVVETYTDDAVGVLGKNSDGKNAMTEVRLRPLVSFSGDAPSREQIEQFHHQSHELCFIANSVTTQVLVELQKEG
ncbi:OsmC family protein [Marinicella sp. W31]|uniref:OsmC family protein n=1 Tax=Marinicella sp. W31 TaxID=3023713 RepID=UPI003757D638